MKIVVSKIGMLILIDVGFMGGRFLNQSYGIVIFYEIVDLVDILEIGIVQITLIV